MKSPLKFALMLFVASVFIVSCGKDDDEDVVPTSTSRTDQLTANKWQMVDIKLDPLGISVWETLDSCEKDDIIEFMANNTGVWDNGTDWCQDDSTQTEQLIWNWLNNEQDLNIPDDTGSTVLKNVQFTATTMTGKTVFEDSIPLAVILKFEAR